MKTTYRSVPESQRSYAMGFNWVFLRLVASMPGPIIVGVFIDRSCMLWAKNCDSSSTCWIYDSKTISYYMTILVAVVKFIGTICFFFSWWSYQSNSIQDIDHQSNGQSCIRRDTEIDSGNKKLIFTYESQV